MALVVLGVFLTFCGAACLALGMVTQRYALSYPKARVPILCFELPRLVAWFCGLMLYAFANGFYAVALNFGPLSLLAGVFTTLLVFNMIFARFFLGERLTPPRVAGSMTILVGVCLCVASAPSGVPTKFLPSDIEDLASQPEGAIYLILLVGGVLASVGGILFYERSFPLAVVAAEPSPAEEEEEEATQTSVDLVEELRPGETADCRISPASTRTSGSKEVRENISEKSVRSSRTPPGWLDRFMAVVYPASLGLDEGIAHLTMKGTLSMFANCGSDESCDHWLMYIFLVLWITASVATVWWLKVVFHRYETTSALPIEYGTVNAASVCSGLIFYGEARYMAGWQFALNLVGLAFILSGIYIGRLAEIALPPSMRSSIAAPEASTPENEVDA